MSLLELHQISKSYGEGATAVHALDEIDFCSMRASLWR